jgi:hypothetical protein
MDVEEQEHKDKDKDVFVIVDHNKKHVELNDNIQVLQREFLNSVTDPRTECDNEMVDVCTLTPNGEYSFLVWNTEFLCGEHVKKMLEEKMFPNDLETMIIHTCGVNVLPQLAFAVLGSIRAVMKPSSVHMMEVVGSKECRIVFCTR